jgi:hypothetical protein
MGVMGRATILVVVFGVLGISGFVAINWLARSAATTRASPIPISADQTQSSLDQEVAKAGADANAAMAESNAMAAEARNQEPTEMTAPLAAEEAAPHRWWVALAFHPGDCAETTDSAQAQIEGQRGYLVWHTTPDGHLRSVDTVGESSGTVTYYLSKADCDAVDRASYPVGDKTVTDQ